MTYRVEITREDERDGEALLEWPLSEGAGTTGLRWFRKLEDAIASLAEFPDRCPLAPESSESPIEVRQLLYGDQPDVYRVLFTIQDDTVFVLHIRHGRRRPQPR